MRPTDSVTGTRWTRWTPLSNLSLAKTPAPVTLATTSLKPPTSLALAGQNGMDSLTAVNPAIVQGVAEAMRVQTGGLGGAFVWPSLIRKLDRTDASYKT